MTRKPISVLVLVLLGSLVLVASGCGGKKGPTGTTTTTTQGATTAQTTTGAATTTASTATTTATATTPNLSSIATAGNCRELAGLATSFGQAISGTGSTDVTRIANVLKEFADRTPAEIRPDFELVATQYAKIAEALKGLNLSSGKVPSPDVLAKLQKLSSEIDQAALTKASAHIQAWAKKTCH